MKLFFWFYFVLYSGNALFGTFVPVYFQQQGFSASEIGLLLSFGPFIAVLAQPVWGTYTDKASSKNRVLILMLIGSGISMLLFPMSTSFGWLMLVISLFTLFQSPIPAVSDAITLEALGNKASYYGHIRIGGTLGFALMSVSFGIYAEHFAIESMFVVYAIVMAASVLVLLLYPNIKGHQFGGRKMNLLELLRNRRLMLYMSICFAINITLGYYYSFFSLYFKGIGAGNDLLGWSMVISSLCELPFLLYSARILKRFSVSTILLFAGGAATLRWLLFSTLDSAWLVLPAQALHGLTFIVVTVTMSVYINKEVPAELRASGQTLNVLINMGAARIIGSYAGGYASEVVGLQNVFLYAAFLLIAALVAFAIISRRMERKGLAGRGIAG
ncbi:MFS transporter, PPP family, 3-phenylpropionic acid transporter [Paenibacillaceae bacterium GAS479]|nr:MFS transporter, PPP family, 3-phenylpropionic acid transporter [Paenibacillaceae bacterium GAS479]